MIKALGGGNSQGKIVNQANRIAPGKCREYEDQSGMRVRLGSGTGKCCPVLFVQRLPCLQHDGKHLKENENIACETYKAVGEIKTLGRYVVMRRCDDFQEDPGVKCIVCFASGEQIRDLCALAHFGSHNVFNLISVPWGPACATLVTYPAGMAENASLSQISIGPTDPSARGWLPENCLAMGIPAEIARKMANDVVRSFLAKIDNVS